MKSFFFISLLTLISIYFQSFEIKLEENIIVHKIDEDENIEAIYTFDKNGHLLSHSGKILSKNENGERESYQVETYYKYDTSNVIRDQRTIRIKEDGSIKSEKTVEFIYSYNLNKQPVKLIIRDKKSLQVHLERECFYEPNTGKLLRVNQILVGKTLENSEKIDTDLYHHTERTTFNYDESGALKKGIKTREQDQILEIYKRNNNNNKFTLTRYYEQGDTKELVRRITQTYNKDYELKKYIIDTFLEGHLPRQEIKFYYNGLINQIKGKYHFPSNRTHSKNDKFILDSKKRILDQKTINLINKTIIKKETGQTILKDYVLKNPYITFY